MGAIIRYTVLTAIRDLLFSGIFIAVIATIGISFFLGSTALVEQREMTLALVAGSTRLILTMGMVIFVCFHLRRCFDNKEIELLLSKAISRSQFTIAFYLGYVSLALLIIVPIIIAIGLLLQPNLLGLLLWGSSVFCELAIVIAFAFAVSLMMKSAIISVFASLGFYIVARLMGFFVISIHLDKLFSTLAVNNLMEWVLMVVSVLLPRLDLFGQSSWLIYGIEQSTSLWVFPLQACIYLPLLLMVAMVDFHKKQF